MLIWVLPAVIIPTVVFLLATKGTDLGQKEADRKAAERAKQEQAQRMSARVPDPERAALEEAEKAAKETRNRLPPPPTAAEIESKSDAARMEELKNSRDLIGSTLNDAERQSTGMADTTTREKRNGFVVYTAPAKEGVVSSAVAAATPDLQVTKPPAEEQKPAKPFLSANDDKVALAGTTVAKRIDGLYWIAPGTVIKAVLLNAIDTQIPGQFTARTTEPVYDSRHGRYLVIPPGSTLNGQYDSAISDGQTRVMMALSSLVTPAGGVVDLNGTRVSDALGRLGVEGELHTHFLKRMGTALLFALESVGVDRLAKNQTTVTTSGSTSTTTNTSEAAKIIADAAKQDPRLKPVRPNITIEEGQKISIVTMASIEVPPIANKR